MCNIYQKLQKNKIFLKCYIIDVNSNSYSYYFDIRKAVQWENYRNSYLLFRQKKVCPVQIKMKYVFKRKSYVSFFIEMLFN